MPLSPKIQPAISTAQELYDYLGISATDAAGNTTSGTTIAVFLKRLLDSTAWEIAHYLGRDYTSAQIITVTFFGNNVDLYVQLPEPGDLAALVGATAWDAVAAAPLAPAISTGDFTWVNTANGDGLQLYYAKGPFLTHIQYQIQYKRGIVTYDAINGWPMPVAQAQREWCALIYRESGNGEDTLGIQQEHLTPTIISRANDVLIDTRKLILPRLQLYRRLEA